MNQNRYRVIVEAVTDDDARMLDVTVDVLSGNDPDPKNEGTLTPPIPVQTQVRAALEAARPSNGY